MFPITFNKSSSFQTKVQTTAVLIAATFPDIPWNGFLINAYGHHAIGYNLKLLLIFVFCELRS